MPINTASIKSFRRIPKTGEKDICLSPNQPIKPLKIDQEKPKVEPSIRDRKRKAREHVPKKKAPKAIAAKPKKADLGDSEYTIQVSSFKNESDAKAENDRIRDMGFESRVLKHDVKDRGTWYRVRVGSFGNKDEANAFKSQLRAKGLKSGMLMKLK